MTHQDGSQSRCSIAYEFNHYLISVITVWNVYNSKLCEDPIHVLKMQVQRYADWNQKMSASTVYKIFTDIGMHKWRAVWRQQVELCWVADICWLQCSTLNLWEAESAAEEHHHVQFLQVGTQWQIPAPYSSSAISSPPRLRFKTLDNAAGSWQYLNYETTNKITESSKCCCRVQPAAQQFAGGGVIWCAWHHENSKCGLQSW